MQRSKQRKAVAALPPGLPEKGSNIRTQSGNRRMHGLDDAMNLVTNPKTRQILRARYQRREGARSR